MDKFNEYNTKRIARNKLVDGLIDATKSGEIKWSEDWYGKWFTYFNSNPYELNDFWHELCLKSNDVIVSEKSLKIRQLRRIIKRIDKDKRDLVISNRDAKFWDTLAESRE